VGLSDLSGLIEHLPHAGLNPALWPQILSEVAEAAGAVGAVLVSADTRFAGLPSSPGLGPMLEDYFRDAWADRDDRYRGVPTLIRSGIMTDADFSTEEERRKSPLYQDLLAKHDLKWIAAVGFTIGGDLWGLSIQRSAAQGPFQPDELARLLALRRPLSDAATLARHLGFIRALGAAEALEMIDQPALLFDHRGRLLAANRSAGGAYRNLMDTSGSAVKFKDPVSQSQFESLLWAAITNQGHPRSVQLGALVRDATGRRLRVRAIALHDWAKYSFSGARVLILLDRARVGVVGARAQAR
jgi:hypothetical protein